MSEENNEVELELDAEPQENNEVEQEELKAEQKVNKSGFMGRDDWIAAGKDPDNWNSPKTYEAIKNISEANTRLHQKIDHITSSHQTDMQNMQTYHNGQLQQQYNKLHTQRDEAIELADKDEVRNIEQQMNNIQQQAQKIQPMSPQQQQTSQAIQDWYNGVMKGNPGREQDIEDKITASLKRNPNNVSAVADEVDAYVSKFKQDTTPKRTAAVTSKSNARSGSSISMANITDEEKAQRAYFKDDKSFLNAVKKVRKAEGK